MQALMIVGLCWIITRTLGFVHHDGTLHSNLFGQIQQPHNDPMIDIGKGGHPKSLFPVWGRWGNIMICPGHSYIIRGLSQREFKNVLPMVDYSFIICNHEFKSTFAQTFIWSMFWKIEHLQGILKISKNTWMWSPTTWAFPVRNSFLNLMNTPGLSTN